MIDGVFFSQFGEDKILYEIFCHKSNGLCIEVGANDGITDSTTYFFEKNGWVCILIEPNPALCAHIRETRKALLFECAASNKAGNAMLYIAEGAERSHGVSTICAEKEALEMIRGYGFTARPIQVKTKTLDSMLDESMISSAIDFISIDVEGHELDVLNGFSIERWKPRIILVEDNSNKSDKTVTEYLQNRGYVCFMRTGVNNWFAHSNNHDILKWKNSCFRSWIFINRTIFSNKFFLRKNWIVSRVSRIYRKYIAY